MTPRPPQRLSDYVPLSYPALMLALFFLVPFATMVAMSFFHRDIMEFYRPGFDLGNYARLLSAFFGRAFFFSIWLSALTALIVVTVAFPVTYVITRSPRRTQVMFLVFILAVLSLSEVIIAFTWSTLLSRTAGISNILVFLGLMEQAEAWTPGFAALLVGLCYLGFPFSVLILYPALSRLDPELPEASRMLGASPARTFFLVVVPVMRTSILSAVIMVFVFNLGAYILPLYLGRPEHWMISVLITDQAIFQSNLPAAAAMAIVLMMLSLFLVALTLMLGQARKDAP
jgi:putative spermidine/putrescine transport system permease protein